MSSNNDASESVQELFADLNKALERVKNSGETDERELGKIFDMLDKANITADKLEDRLDELHNSLDAMLEGLPQGEEEEEKKEEEDTKNNTQDTQAENSTKSF